MKAIVLKAPHTLVQEDIERPALRDGRTLVRVTHSGVCGTDLKIYQGGIPVNYPRIMGHEMIGEVVEVGDAMDVETGARVIIDPVIFCGQCQQCLSGKENLCPNGYLLGRDRDGGFSEYMLAPSDALFPLPDNISDSCAPLIQVMTTCLHAQRRVDIVPGEAVVVIGLGVAGQLHVQLAKSRGADPIIGVTGSAVRRSMAEQFGADVTLAPGDDVTERVRELTDGRGADLVIESAGAVSTLAQAINLAKLGGRLLLFGIYTVEEAALPFYQLYFKELSIINARAAKREDYPACIDLVGSGQVELEPMISHVLPLNELERAISMLGERDDQRMKVILDHT
jgi:2-desacetyl-2-hydroxyethyl bacteriochlorophyllide A dehydrogenase